MFLFAVDAFENVGTWITLFGCQSWRSCLLIFHTISFYLLMILYLVWAIALDTLSHVRSTSKGRMSPLPVVFASWYFWVYICTLDCMDMSTDIELLIDDVFCFQPILWVPDIDPYYSHIRLREHFDNLWLQSQNNIVK